MVRTAVDPASLIARIRAEAATMDPDVPIAGCECQSRLGPWRRRNPGYDGQ
jgi:hypothetical protein